MRQWLQLFAGMAVLATAACHEPTAPKPVGLILWDGPTEFGMRMMGSLQLNPRMVDADGDTQWVSPAPRLTSRNPDVISVDGNVITARAVGFTWVVAALVVGDQALADSVSARVVCTRELGSSFSPSERTLAVGDLFTPTVSLWSCGGHERLADTFIWSAHDTAVVRVDPLSGRTTALRPGQTFVLARGATYGTFVGPRVTVIAAAER